MNIGDRAFEELFPKKKTRNITLKYSKAFSPYNANVKYQGNNIEFSFSHVWKDIGDDIQVGLAQHLLLKVFKEKQSTLSIELYEKFMEKLPKYVQNTELDLDPELVDSFNRVNEAYFNDFMEVPKLEWGQRSTRQLGLYSYHADSVRMSRIFQGLDGENSWMLDYVMYHELLHKKLGVKQEGGSCRHHTKKFRELEAKFKEPNAEKRLQSFVSKQGSSKTRLKTEKQESLLGVMRNLFK